MKLASMTAIVDIVAPVVLIAMGVLTANGLLSTYTYIIDQIRTSKRERLDTPSGERLHEIDRQLAIMDRRVELLHHAVLIIFGGIALLVLSVIGIAFAVVNESETVGVVALGLVIAGTVAMLTGLVVVVIAYAPRRAFKLQFRRLAKPESRYGASSTRRERGRSSLTGLFRTVANPQSDPSRPTRSIRGR